MPYRGPPCTSFIDRKSAGLLPLATLTTKGKGNDKSLARAVKYKEEGSWQDFYSRRSLDRGGKKVFFKFEDLQATAGHEEEGELKSKAENQC